MAEAYKDLDPATMTRSPGLTYQDLLDLDSREVPEVLRLQSPKDMGLNEFSVERYTTKRYHDLEVAKLWKKVWQFTCREEDIPEPGDHYRYDIAGMSFLVVRTETGEIKAYPNACLHRGRMLKEFDGNAAELRCPFHGFCWKLDGTLSDIPADWDFPSTRAHSICRSYRSPCGPDLCLSIRTWTASHLTILSKIWPRNSNAGTWAAYTSRHTLPR